MKSGGELSKTQSYELDPFSYQTPIKIGLKNAFFPFPRKHENEITLETPIKLYRKGVKTIPCLIDS
jgi:hypothetical protein